MKRLEGQKALNKGCNYRQTEFEATYSHPKINVNQFETTGGMTSELPQR